MRRGSEGGPGREMRVRGCMQDARVQPIKDIEPTTHQMACGPNVNKIGRCVVLPQSPSTRCLILKR